MKKLMFKMKKVAFAASLLCVSVGVFGMENQNTEWFEAAKSGNLSQLSQIIERGVDLNAKDEEGHTALMIAAREGRLDVVNRLIIPSNNQVLSLVLEWKRGGRKLSKQSVRQWRYDYKAVDVNARNKVGETALMKAAGGGHYEIARLLVYEGADVNATTRAFENSGGDTALMIAARKGYSDIARLLIDEGADINAADGSGETPLLHSVRYQYTNIAKLLIDAGADVNVAEWARPMHTWRGRSVLAVAIENGDLNLVRWLIKAGADVDAAVADSYYETPLRLAWGKNRWDIVRLLVKAGADINLGAPEILMNAVAGGRLPLVKQLIKAGADVNARDEKDDTALSRAIAYKSEPSVLITYDEERACAMIRLLVAAGADVNADNGMPYPALIRAINMGRPKVMQLLIDSGTDIGRVGSRALKCARNRKNNSEMVRILEEAGAK